jgi:hypothetical protein
MGVIVQPFTFISMLFRIRDKIECVVSTALSDKEKIEKESNGKVFTTHSSK